MALNRQFVLFELNEVPLRVVRHFAEKRPGSAFAKLLATGQRWTTITHDRGHLSPWITWPTLHRGVPSDKHQIVALGQDVADADRHYPPVWRLLAGGGRRVGVFGSLHSYPPPSDLAHYDFYVPDTFAAGPETEPPQLSAFQKFNLSMVDRSGRNVSAELGIKDALGFFLRVLPQGVRATTLAKIVRQVASERISRDRVGRRRTIQSLLSFDLFIAQLQSKRPNAAFFFTNHVASSMHRYWPATFTEDYRETQWSDSWIRRFSGELDYTMGEADEMLAALMHFADQHPEYLILVTGSMGQSAVDSPERQVKTEVLLRDMGRFLAQLNVTTPWERRRTMEPTYTLAFQDGSATEKFLEAIATLRIAGQSVEHKRLNAREAEFCLGFPNLPDDQFTVTIGNSALDPAEAGLSNVTIEDEVGAAAYHVPEGMLLAYDPWRRRASAEAKLISTTRIAPTLLALQGIRPPPYMEQPIGDLLAIESKSLNSAEGTHRPSQATANTELSYP